MHIHININNNYDNNNNTNNKQYAIIHTHDMYVMLHWC